MGASKVITVGIAELKLARTPAELAVIGLGSCIGVCLYDSGAGLGGIAHVMLPDSTQGRGMINEAKYADTAVQVLLNKLIDHGALLRRIKAKIAGGAQMFSSLTNHGLQIGERNALAVRKALQQCRVALVAEDCGGYYGRSIRLDPGSGRLYVKTIDHGEKWI